MASSLHAVGALVWIAGSGCGTQGSGQTGSLGPLGPQGPTECEETLDCVEHVQAALAPLSAPSTSSRTFSSAECIHVSVIGADPASSANGPTCQCSVEGSGSMSVGPAGLGCYVYGRGGDCLWDDSEFDGCIIGEAGACTAVCDELEARLAADAARTFETRVVYTACEQSSCHNVVEIDGRCFADHSYRNGQAYDCSLGAEAILEQHFAASAGPELDELPPGLTPYVAGTDGFVELAVSTQFWGTAWVETQFGAMAQFFEVTGTSMDYGDVIDPLEGVDDCGVAVRGGTGVAPDVRFVDIAELTLHDESLELPFEPANVAFPMYILDLTQQRIAPRYGGIYGISGSGGGFGSAISVANLRLPEALSIPVLEASPRIERAELRLTWSGRGSAPLRLRLWVNERLADFFEPFEIECLLADDGEYVIPADVMTAAPEGFATAIFTRENRSIAESGGKSLVLIGRTEVTHRFALGSRCDRPDVVEACARHAEQIVARYAECGTVAPPPIEMLCPDYLVEACNGCPEYFDCVARNTRCESGGLTVHAGCSCS